MSYFCTNCGFEIADYDANFCPNCGFALNGERQQSSGKTDGGDDTLDKVIGAAVGLGLLNSIGRNMRRHRHRSVMDAFFHPGRRPHGPRPGPGPGPGGRGPGGRGPGGRGPGGRGPGGHR